MKWLCPLDITWSDHEVWTRIHAVDWPLFKVVPADHSVLGDCLAKVIVEWQVGLCRVGHSEQTSKHTILYDINVHVVLASSISSVHVQTFMYLAWNNYVYHMSTCLSASTPFQKYDSKFSDQSLMFTCMCTRLAHMLLSPSCIVTALKLSLQRPIAYSSHCGKVTVVSPFSARLFSIWFELHLCSICILYLLVLSSIALPCRDRITT